MKQTNEEAGEGDEENMICLSQLYLKLTLSVCLLRVRKFL